MLKIVFVIDHLGQGGAQKMLWHLASNLVREKGYEVVVVSLQKRNVYSEWFEREGIKLVHCGIEIEGNPLKTATFIKTLIMSGWKMMVSFIRLIKLIRHFKPNIITTFLFGADFFGAVAGVATRTKVVCAIRATNIWKKWWHKLAGSITYPLVNYFTVNSTPSRDYLHEAEKVPLSKIHCIFNGVDLPAKDGWQNHIRSSYGIRESEFWIVAAGRLDEQKGFDYLIKAAAMLEKHGVNFVLSIFGDGHLRGRLEDLILALNLKGRVRLEGYVDGLMPVFWSADLFVLSSIYEGMPNVLLEAMAAGLPVVATSVDGVCDIIAHDREGIVVPPAQPDDLYGAICRLYENDNERKELSQNGYSRLESAFSMDSMCNKYHLLYGSIVNYV